ncbi:hypothetical protein WJX75_002917 [Coccomyxa subellipsoidea]|uniref:Uncharacterized protein n=1 Tax=Coccomyxa subellipsoidea TaxID=248742 RepID=A0ABR2YKR2_9CHLO
MRSQLTRRFASSFTYGVRVNYFPHLSTNKQPISVSQERQSGHQVQGRDKSMPHVMRSSMSDPVYFTRSSISDPDYVVRNLVTPQVNVPEGSTHVSTADYPMPMRHSMSEPAVFDEVVPDMNRKVS